MRAEIRTWPAEQAVLAACGSVAVLWCVLLLSRYVWIFGGDPEIHLIFARNLLQGHLLEFNPGFRTGGETSPLYMLIVAALCTALGAFAAYGMKALAFLALGGICYLLFVVNDTASVARRWAMVLLAMCMPFFVFQASLGMENMLFAALTLAVLHASRTGSGAVRVVRFFPLIMPLLFFLRPEAVFIAFWLGCMSLYRRRPADALIVVGSVAITDWITLATLFLIPALLHIFNVLPNVQFSRYFLFEYAVLLYVFSSRLLGLIDTRVLAGLWTGILLLGLAETHARANHEVDSVVDSIRKTSPAGVKAYSDSLIARLHPATFPVVFATQEVQIRGQLDSRFLVWSLDGITDFELGQYLKDGYIDHFAYLRQRQVEFVLGLQSYNRDPQRPSLQDFTPGNAEAARCIEGLRLEPTPEPKVFRVSRCAVGGSPTD